VQQSQVISALRVRTETRRNMNRDEIIEAATTVLKDFAVLLVD
jgi:hypothetical protein